MLNHEEIRFQNGLEKLAEVDGHAGEKVIAALQDIAPDFARLLVSFPLATSTADQVSI